MLTCLAGGVGSARLLSGLARIEDDLVVIVNTADDESIRGLHLSPDLDTVMYHLAGLSDWERGWGTKNETFHSNDRFGELVASIPQDLRGIELHEWLALGDKDLATNLFRTRLLQNGVALDRVTDILRRAAGIKSRILPVTNDRLQTRLTNDAGVAMSLQEYFVKQKHTATIKSIDYVGASVCAPAPGVVETIADATTIIIGPSNPFLSVLPILEVPGVRDALKLRSSRTVAVSPIVGGASIKGPLAELMRGFNHEVSPVGIARIYGDLVDVWVIDNADAHEASRIEHEGISCVVTDTLMTSPDAAAQLASVCLQHAIA